MQSRSILLTATLSFVLALSLTGVAGAGNHEDRRPENPGEQADEHRQDEQARDRQPQGEPPESLGRSAEAPHGHAHGHDQEPGEAPPEAQADDDNIPDGNKGSVKVRSHGADPHPPRTETHLDCIFDVLFYGFASSGATATLTTQAPTEPTGQQVGPVLSASWEPANRPGSDFVGRVTFDLRGTIDNGDFTHHEQQGYHLRLTVTNDDREAPGNRKHKVFWVDCPPGEPEGAALGTAGEDEEPLGAAGGALEDAEEQDEVVTEVGGVLEERSGVAVAAVGAAAVEARPAVPGTVVGALAATGIGLLSLLLLALASIVGGAGALRLGRE